jgi:peroxiredoxin
VKVKVGDKAPDFTLLSQKGESVTLSQFFGKKNVVLYFYPKDESRGCTREACEFRDKYEVFKDLDAEVIGVSSDDMESHGSFARSLHRESNNYSLNAFTVYSTILKIFSPSNYTNIETIRVLIYLPNTTSTA